jgi:trans-aconitate methyltransferase
MERKEDFYGTSISTDRYLIDVKRLLPQYNELVRVITSRVLECSPQNILDLGSGVGNIDDRILNLAPSAKITCIEPAMAEACRERLSKYGERVKVSEHKAEEMELTQEYDIAFYNLALHNLSVDNKIITFNKLRRALKKDAPFIWGDLIAYNRVVQEALVANRHIEALCKGASLELVKEDWDKERNQDVKLTIAQTKYLCQLVGFRNFQTIYHSYLGTAAVFYMEN